jgi:hypothetical protein
VVALVALLVGAAAAIVVASLDDSGKGGAIATDSTSTGIPTTSESASETSGPTTATSKTVPPTSTVAEYEVDGPVRTGTVELRSQTSYDLDHDRQAYPGEGADVVLDCCALHAFPDDRMSFPRGDRPADCLGQPTRQNVVVEELREHPTLCVITDQGGLATVHATLVSAPLETFQRVSITYELWSVSR